METGLKLNLTSSDVDSLFVAEASGLILNLETGGSSEVGSRFFFTVYSCM